MASFGYYDPDDVVVAWEKLLHLDKIAQALRAEGLSTEVVDNRRQELCSRPVRVYCYRCRRRTVTVTGLAKDAPPVCGECNDEACDLLYCFARARAAITLGNTTLMRCEGHALLLWDKLMNQLPAIRPLLIRHLPKEA